MTAAAEKGRVLVVDDEPGVRETLARGLETVGGYRADQAADGVEALERVRASDYDVVFTDIAMPRMNGIEFLRRSKRLRPAVPVVVVTGVSAMEVAVSAIREGASDFLTKPVRLERLVAATDRIVGERRLLGRFAAAKGPGVSLKSLNAELFRRLQEIMALHAVSAEIDALYSNREIYNSLAGMGAKLFAARDVAFGIVEDGRLRIRSAVGEAPPEVPLSGGIAGEVLRDGGHRLADVGEPHPLTGRPLDAQCLLLPLLVGTEVVGMIAVSGKSDGTAFSDEEVYLALNLAKKAATKIENNALYEVFLANLLDTLGSLVATIEARDSYTRQHSERVTTYSLRVAETMGLGSEEADAIRFSGFLHDIGKIGVRDTVLLKPGGLTREEFEEIRRHSVIGDEIVSPIKFLNRERRIIRHHHEHFGGGGYPDGIGGEEIPVTARILTVADTYDAMTSNRPYRTARTHAEAVAELSRCAGSQFDPEVVRAFLSSGAGVAQRG